MRKTLLPILAMLCAAVAGAQQQDAAGIMAALENPNEIFVIARNGDWHGTTANSIESLRKTIEKGAQMASVDLMRDEQGDVVLNVDGGQRPSLKEALEYCRGKLVLVLANPSSYLDDIRSAAKETQTTDQVLLYGMSDPKGEIRHIAVYQLGGSAKLSDMLAANPIAVEIDYSTGTQGLEDAIATVKKSSRLMFNTADEGKCGSVSDPKSPNNAAEVWAPLIQMGATVFLTNQIKPFMWYLHPETRLQTGQGGPGQGPGQGRGQGGPGMGGPRTGPRGQGGPGQGGKGLDKSYDTYLTALKETVPHKFKVYTYNDAETGREMQYNLYAPADYASVSYPLVLFIPDASTVGKGPEHMLTQGYGGLVWATDEWQTEHPCIVLVPAFSGPDSAVNDKWGVSSEVACCKNLLEKIVSEYNADTDRLYTTGQSMGGMISMYFDATYPGYFAAAMFVSCQWDTSVLSPLSEQKFLYVISAADPKASPKMKELGDLLTLLGASWGEIEFSARLPLDEQNALVDDLLSKGDPINFVRFKPNTVMPEGRESPMAEHMYGFDAAYRLQSLRDWLFKQSK